MLELLVEVCLADRGAPCVERLLPGSCVEARAQDWVAAQPDLTLAGWRCVEPGEAVEPLPVVEIAEGLFVHQGRHELPNPSNAGDEANIGFIIGDEAVAVIDAGGSRSVGERLYAAIRARTDLPIAWLILTHMHPDHVLGASVFAEAGATVIAHARLPDALLNRAQTYTEALLREAGPEAAMASAIVLPDETVAERREIDLGNRRLILEAHPTAHTDNDLTILDLRTGTWWLGDLIFEARLPALDGSALGWLALLDALAARPTARVVPGHGAPALPWPAATEPVRDYLAALVAQTRAALDAGESLSAASRTLGRDLRGEWLLFDEFNGRNATTIYRELEWE